MEQKMLSLGELEGIIPELAKNWMLICAPDSKGSANLMTASWGGIGRLWEREVVFAFVRDQRYTHELLDQSDVFSLVFPNPEQYREQLKLCGAVSGRDQNKMAECGFHLAWQQEIPYVTESSKTILCKKIAKIPITAETLLDPELDVRFYQNMGGGYHDLYIGEVAGVLLGK